MIHESARWKNELLKTSTNLKRKMKFRRWAEPSYVALEKDIMISAYIVRKLNESMKLSGTTGSRSVKTVVYPRNEMPFSIFSRDMAGKHFHLDKGKDRTISAKKLCDIIIHAVIFSPCFDEESSKLCSFLITSTERFDKEKQENPIKDLYHIRISEYVDLLEFVGKDYPDTFHWTRKKGQIQ